MDLKEKLKAEITAIENEAAQIIGRSKYLHGAKQMAEHLLKHVEDAEKAISEEVKKEPEIM